jgi:leucyl-tRNA synthetase
VRREALKMSKSKGNSVTPDAMAEQYGADALRLYVLFTAPFEDTIEWNEDAMAGTSRFLNRVWDQVTTIAARSTPPGPKRSAPLPPTTNGRCAAARTRPSRKSATTLPSSDSTRPCPP